MNWRQVTAYAVLVAIAVVVAYVTDDNHGANW